MDKTYIGDCVCNPFDSVEELVEIIENAEEITMDEFLENCDISGLTWYGSGCLGCTMRDYPNDFSFYKNGDIYFYENSATEHFFQ